MVTPASERIPALAQLYVYVTDICNCACVHCWIVSGATEASGKPGHFIAPEILEAAIAEAVPLGLTAIKWTGGEPTIHPDFPALLAIQKRYRLQGRMETNGLRLTPQLTSQLQDSGVSHISVSLDGVRAETHDAIRGVRGAWERAVAGIGHLVAVGYHPQIIMSLMRRNVAEMEDMLSLAGQLGVGSVKFNIVQPNLRGKQLHAVGEALPVAELIALNRKVERELARSVAFPIYFDIPLAFRSLGNILVDGPRTCGIKNILGLLSDGSYALCGIGVNIPAMVFGRVKQGQLVDVWKHHQTLRDIRDGLPQRLVGICGKCLMSAACLGACLAQNYHDAGTLTAEFWFCRMAADEGLFPQSRLLEQRRGCTP